MGLWGFIARRLVLSVVVLFIVSVGTFGLMHAIPGDPIASLLGERQADNPEVRKALEDRWGLNDPLPVQYMHYVWNLLQGDMGESISKRQPVAELLRVFVPATAELAIAAMLFAILIGAPLGIIAAIKQDGLADHISRFISLIGTSMPVFWLGLLVSYVFFYELRWLPRQGRLDIGLDEPPLWTGMITVDAIKAGDWNALRSVLLHLIMPACVLGSFAMGIIARMLRSSLVAALNDDYIRTARAKGLVERKVVAGHALRNALIPTITVVGLTFASLLAGAVLTETIFDWPGIGRFAYETAIRRDYPGLLGVTLIIAVGYILVNLFVDIIYGILDPRIRVS